MSSFSEFSKAHRDEDNKNQKSKPTKSANKTPSAQGIAKNRIDPDTGNEREDRATRNMHEVNDYSNTRVTRDSTNMSNSSLDETTRETSRL